MQRPNRPQKDIRLYRMIIAAPGLTVIATVVGAIILASTGLSIPDAVVLSDGSHWRHGRIPGSYSFESIAIVTR